MYTIQHAAERHDEQRQQQEERRYGPHADLTLEELRNLLDSTPQTAFKSGYADLTEDEFNTNYLDQLDEAIRPMTRGDTFVMAAGGGFAESKAPEYLSANGVPEDRVHIYDVNPATGELDTIHHSRGDRPITVIIGKVAERDAVLTNKSGYDILWLRTVDEESRWEPNAADSLDPKFDIVVKENARRRRALGLQRTMAAYERLSSNEQSLQPFGSGLEILACVRGWQEKWG
ncbi:hypothetical protein LTR74_014073 [Friedmanniomyces endolithicus]|nr:hypothetical protein LTR74_014073 [Friedmanniomyces endolithicus]